MTEDRRISDRRMPPAVAEFALEQLAAKPINPAPTMQVEPDGWWNVDNNIFTAPIRIGTWGARIECHGHTKAAAFELANQVASAADNCESLRARLAKYEDAEGRPVVAGDYAWLSEDLRVNADAHPLDVRLQVMSEAADALESQAREIERLTSALDSDKPRKMVAEARAELADLKAQPSGVVLPERFEMEPYQTVNKGSTNYKAGFNAAVKQMRESLNSSPVSSAPSHGEQVRHMVPSWMASARTFVDRLHLAGWRDHADAQHAGVAGMYDELLAATPSLASHEQW